MTRKVGMLESAVRISDGGGATGGDGLGQNIRRHAVLAGYLLLGIDIDLDKLHPSWFCFLLGEVLEDRRNRLAGPAPVSIEVDNGVRGIGEQLREVCSRGDGYDFARHGVVLIGVQWLGGQLIARRWMTDDGLRRTGVGSLRSL